jgi:hypothetical protein
VLLPNAAAAAPAVVLLYMLALPQLMLLMWMFEGCSDSAVA